VDGDLQEVNRTSSMDWRKAVREGVYPVAFAAKLTETTNARVASWFRTRDGSRLAPAILTPFEPVAGQVVMPFLAVPQARAIASDYPQSGA
jgi:hypothetical protein